MYFSTKPSTTPSNVSGLAKPSLPHALKGPADMHELSIARAIVQRTLASVELAPNEEVSRVFVDLGAHSGVHEDSLRFCLDLVKADTPLSSASIELRVIALEFVCRACGSRQVSESFSLICHACGASDVEIIAGMEARVTGAEIRTKSANLQKDEE